LLDIPSLTVIQPC